MSTAQGQFTIIDYNDALTLTGYIGANLAKTQMYNPDNDTYSPDWSSTNLVLTPSLYVIGTITDQITSTQVTSPSIYKLIYLNRFSNLLHNDSKIYQFAQV